MYAGNSLAKNAQQKKEIFSKAAQLFPADYRPVNNLAAVAISEQQNSIAQSYLDEASRLNANASDVNSNLATLALINGDIEKAEQLYAKSPEATNINEALGNLAVAKGQYAKAAQLLKGVNSNTAALAQILNNNYQEAASILSNIKNADATTSYLKAVLAARQNDSNSVIANLRDAIAADSSFAQRAKADIEFKNYEGLVSAIAR
jgi:uncharacterized protein HemY